MPDLTEEFDPPQAIDLSAEFSPPKPVDLTKEFSPPEPKRDLLGMTDAEWQDAVSLAGPMGGGMLVRPTEENVRTMKRGGATALRIGLPIAAVAAAPFTGGASVPAAMGLAALGGLAAEPLAQTLEKSAGDREDYSLSEGAINVAAAGLAPLAGAAGGRAIKAATGLRVVESPVATTGQKVVSAAVHGIEGASINAGQDTALRVARGEDVTAGTIGHAALIGAGLGTIAGAAFDEVARSITLDRMFSVARKSGFKGDTVDDLRSWWQTKDAAASAATGDAPAAAAATESTGSTPSPDSAVIVLQPQKPAGSTTPEAARAAEPIDYSLLDSGEGKSPSSDERASGWAEPPKTDTGAALTVPVSTSLDPARHPVVEYPLDRIVINKDVPQFKGDADSKTGVTEPLAGKYERLGTAPVVLWQKAGGETEVITGRHRIDLARRSGEKTIPAQVVKEEDGFTRQHALIFDAESNIRDGQGEIKDYALYFRETRDALPRDTAEARGLLARVKGRAGFSLGHDAGDGLFALYENGKIAEAKAVAIARGAPGDEAAQASAIRAAKGKTASELELYARNLSRLTVESHAGGNQMGFDEIAPDFAAFEQEADAVAKVQSEKIRQNTELIQAAAGAAKRPEAARKMGLPVDDPAALTARIDELKAANAKLHNPDPETFEAMRREAGLPPHESGTASPTEAKPGNGELFDTSGAFNLSSETQRAPEGTKPPAAGDETAPMFSDAETRSTPPTDLDKRNETSRGGGTNANAEAAPEAGVGGDLGEPHKSGGTDVADDRERTVFPIELPEMVALAKDLGGGKYPVIVEKIRALKGHALGVFIHADGPGGEASIELRADIFELVSPQEKRLLREQAAEYAKAVRAADPSVNEARVASERYEFLLSEAFEAAKKKNPKLASKVLAHEIGHWVDWLPQKLISGRGNLFARIASLKGFTKSLLPEKPGAPGELTDADRARLHREAKQLAAAEKAQAGGDPQDEAVVAPEEILEIWQNPTARDKDPGLYEYVARLTPLQKKELVKAAMRGKIADWFVFRRDQMPKLTKSEQEFYADLLKAEINKRRLFDLEEMKAELRPMIAWWRGTDRMESYFEPSEEMYAETFSVLLNNPAAVVKRAPRFYEAFFNYLGEKPEVKRLYDQIQDDIKSGQIYKDRVDGLRESWARGDALGLQADKMARRVPLQERLDDFRMTFDRTFGPVYRRMNASKAPTANVEKAIEDYIYRAASHELFLRRLNLEVLGPLVKQNVDWVDLAEYMLHQHIIHNRANLANTRGFNPKASTERLREMETQFGPERFAALEEGQRTFRRIFEDVVIRQLDEAQVFDPKLMKVIRDRLYYATMSALHENAYEDSIEAVLRGRFGDGVTSHVYKQVGYLGDVKNPATATAQKALSLISMAYREQTKREIGEFMLQDGDPMIQEAPMRWTGLGRAPVEVKNDRIGTMVFLHRGKVRAYYVPRAVADAFEHASPVDARLMSTIHKVLSPIKAIYTELNYGFWPVALRRDKRSFARKMPGAALHFGPKAIDRYLPKARAAAKASLEGKPSALADDALDRHMLISRAEPRGEAVADDAFERMLLRFGMNPTSWRDENLSVGKRLVELWNWYKRQGQINERAVKIAGMMYLDEHFPKMPEVIKQRLVHEQSGSPNFLQRPRGGPIIDMFALFYNPWKEGLRSEYRAWTLDQDSFKPGGNKGKTARGRSAAEMFAKWALYTAPLAIVAWMFENDKFEGLLPEDQRKRLRDMYRSISEYDKTNYHVIPIMWADEAQKKVLYVRLPLEEGERLQNGILRKALTDGEGGQGILSFAGGQLPGENPVLQTARAWFTFKVTGQNPYDPFRGRNILRDDVFEAGQGDAALAKWSANQLGAGLVVRFSDDSLYDPPKTAVEKILNAPVVSNLIGRWVKVSNRGYFERAQAAGEPVRQERAELRLIALDLLHKLDAGETFTEDEKRLLQTKPYLVEYLSGKLPAVMKRRSSPEARALLNAQSKAERAKVIEELQKN